MLKSVDLNQIQGVQGIIQLSDFSLIESRSEQAAEDNEEEQPAEEDDEH